MPWEDAATASVVAEEYGLELDELLAMANYCNLSDLRHAGNESESRTSASTGAVQQHGLLLAAAAQAATLPLDARWSMHVAEGGRM